MPGAFWRLGNPLTGIASGSWPHGATTTHRDDRLRYGSSGSALPAIQTRANCEAECLCKLESLVNEWESRARTAFLEGYFGEACSGVGNLLPGDFRARCALVSYFELDKAMYEAGYELNNRPDWVVIPLKGILQIMERWGGNTR